MKILKIVFTGALIAAAVFLSASTDKTANAPGKIKEIHEGDILFLSSDEARSRAIQMATKSPYSHTGIVVKTRRGMMVLEAVQPVKFTYLSSFLKRSPLHLIKRLKDNRIIHKKSLARLRNLAVQMAGKDYDYKYEWSDEKMYCSELVWKLYKRAFGIELAPLKRLKDYDLNHEPVQKALRKVYGKQVPYEQTVIAPSDLVQSPYLIDVN